MKSDAVKSRDAAGTSIVPCSMRLGMTEEELKKPLVGIVSSYNEIVPGHMNL